MSSFSDPLQRLLPLILLTVFLLSGCGASAPKDADGKEFTKKLYLDANLEFSLTVPEDWSRRFVTTPQSSTAPYAVLWSSPVNSEEPDGAVIEIQATVMQPEDTDDPQQLADLFSQSVPGFNTTALRPLEDVLIPTLELLGYNAARTYRVIFIQDTDHLYLLSFSAPPEHYEEYRKIFDMVFFSFAPLDE